MGECLYLPMNSASALACILGGYLLLGLFTAMFNPNLARRMGWSPALLAFVYLLGLVALYVFFSFGIPNPTPEQLAVCDSIVAPLGTPIGH